jgi:hypothetical protein
LDTVAEVDDDGSGAETGGPATPERRAEVGGGEAVAVGGVAVGGVPVRTPAPFASAGRIRIQPGVRSSGSVSLPPSGCTRFLFRSKISV